MSRGSLNRRGVCRGIDSCLCLAESLCCSAETAAAAAAAKSLESCPSLCDPTDSSAPGSSVQGSLQATTLEWVAVSVSNACMHAKSLESCPSLCDPTDSSAPVSSVHGSLHATTLEWFAVSFSETIILLLIGYTPTQNKML